jgi:hypothetical protein
MADWQPIETAPKDGSRIDGWAVNTVRPENVPGRYSNMWWEDGEWVIGQRYQPFPIEAPIAATGEPVVKLTHWMPLPEPPALTPPSSPLA